MRDPDQGRRFGTWPDRTSRLIYHDAMPALLSGVDTALPTVDLGGGNGLAREWFPYLTTVDSDATKAPDVVADIVHWTPGPGYRPQQALLRYVLHYLPDGSAGALLRHVAGYCPRLLVVQFVNHDLAAKLANSVGERKWFRPEHQLANLVQSNGWAIDTRLAVDYYVDPDFYRYRLGHPNPTGHPEMVVAYHCERA